MVEQILNYLDKFTPEILLIQVGFLLIVISVFTFFWIQNKRKFNHLKHQIPANVVKSYLDSIIQNSSSLKSSLFRGGGLDIDPNGIPSVFPVGNLDGKDQAEPMGTSTEEIRLKIAEIAQLKAQLLEKNNMLRDSEGNITNLRGETRNKQDRIEELEKLLAAARSGSPVAAAPTQDNSALKQELASVTKERDELRQKLQEYSIIEDDLANLKRLKQENEQLKRSLGQAPAVAAAPVSAVEETFAEPEFAPEIAKAPAIEEAPVLAEEEAPVLDTPEEAPIAAASAQEEAPSASEGKDKSPEDLLSEFEKMLG